jgi:hypothetical protein
MKDTAKAFSMGKDKIGGQGPTSKKTSFPKGGVTGEMQKKYGRNMARAMNQKGGK